MKLRGELIKKMSDLEKDLGFRSKEHRIRSFCRILEKRRLEVEFAK